jgi:cephalosporin hydroxylase
MVVELGNRRGCSTLAIYDALKEGQKFYSLDIIDDCRYVPDSVKNDERVTIINDFDSLDAKRVKSMFEPKSIAMLFADTIHTYEQIRDEYNVWKPYLKDDFILVVDDIVSDYVSSDKRTKGIFHEEWKGVKFDVTMSAHRSGFGIYLK